MPTDKPARYRLAPKAESDLAEIWQYTAQTWSLDQADTYLDQFVAAFELIAALPTVARERSEFTPPIRIHVHQSHLIIYRWHTDVVILRILGDRQNWQAILTAIDN